MNPLYELVPITEKPEKDGWYVVANDKHPGDLTNIRLWQVDMWRGLQDFTHYLRPYTPAASKSAEGEFAEWASEAGYRYHRHGKTWEQYGSGIYKTTSELIALYREQNEKK